MASSFSSPIFSMIMFSMWLLISCSEAREYVVGGSEDSWKVPLSSPDSLTQWATSHRFRIGDAIIFRYDNRTESVHVVDEDDYLWCETEGRHVVFNDGATKVVFTNSGPKFFISGDEYHCQMGLKLAVVVVSNKRSTEITPPSPPPSPQQSPSPLPLPSPSPSPLPSPSPSPQPSSGNQQGVAVGRGFIIMWLGVSLAMMTFLF